MSYILVCNPKIMHTHWCEAEGHENKCPSVDDVVVATALSSAVGSLICGLLGHLPFVLAPGIGLSAYFSYGLVIHGAQLEKEVALATVVLSGLVILALTAVRAGGLIMSYMPNCIKSATVVGMGLLIAFVGFHSTKMVVPDKESVVKLGDLYQPASLLTMGGLMLVGVLMHFQIKGSILISILSITLISWISGVTDWPTAIVKIPEIDTVPRDVIMKGFPGLGWNCITPVLTFVLVSMLDIAGVMHGVAKMADLVDEDNNVQGGQLGFMSAGVGTVLAGILGSTPVIIGIESASGISEGGRSGLVACVAAALFAVSSCFAPLFGHIPPQATAPVLILIGTMMSKNATEGIDWDNLNEAIPSFLTIVVMPFTFSIPNGLAAGLASYIVLWVCTGQWWTLWRTRTLEHGYSTVVNADEGEEQAGKQGGYVTVDDSESFNSRNIPKIQRDSFYHWNDPENPDEACTQMVPRDVQLAYDEGHSTEAAYP